MWPAGVNTVDIVDNKIRSVWSLEYHHAHRCCVSVDVETAASGQG